MNDYGDDYMRMKFCCFLGKTEDEIVDQYMISTSEYIFVLDDGRKFLFDIFGDVIQRIGYPELDHVTEDLWKKEFARRVKKMSRRKGYYMMDLAKELGISEQRLSRYMTVKSIPNGYMIKRMSEILGCPVEYLMDFDYLL